MLKNMHITLEIPIKTKRARHLGGGTIYIYIIYMHIHHDNLAYDGFGGFHQHTIIYRRFIDLAAIVTRVVNILACQRESLR